MSTPILISLREAISVKKIVGFGPSKKITDHLLPKGDYWILIGQKNNPIYHHSSVSWVSFDLGESDDVEIGCAVTFLMTLTQPRLVSKYREVPGDPSLGEPAIKRIVTTIELEPKIVCCNLSRLLSEQINTT